MQKKKDYLFEVEKFSNAFFFLILGTLILICIMMVWPFIKILGWAVALAIVSYPLHNFILKRLKSPTFSALLSSTVMIVVILIPAIFLILGIIQEAVGLSQVIELWVEEKKYEHFYNKLLNVEIFKNTYQYLNQRFDLSQINLQSTLSEMLKNISSFLGKQGVGLVKNVVLFLVQAGMVLVIFFFLLRDGKRIISFIQPFVPLSEEKMEVVLSRATDTVRATVYGWLVVGIIQGSLLGIIFAILKLPSPLFWGGVTVIFCFVPFAGAPVIWVPASLILLAQGVWWKAIVLALWGAIVINLTDNFLRPILVGAKLKLHPMVVFFAIFGGLFLMGPLGLLMGPATLAVSIVLLDILRIKLNQEEVVIIAPEEIKEEESEKN